MSTLNNRIILRNIKLIAKKRNKTLKEISLDLGRHENFVSTMVSKKKGLLSLELLFEIAQVLQCDIADLLVEKPPKP